MTNDIFGIIFSGHNARGYKERARISREETGMNMVLIPNTDESYECIRRDRPLTVQHWTGKCLVINHLALPKVIYDRRNIKDPLHYEPDPMTQAFLERGCHFINHPTTRALCADKWKLAKFFEENGFRTPETAKFSSESLELFLKKHDRAFIKKRNASRGDGQLYLERNGTKYYVKRPAEKGSHLPNLDSVVRLTVSLGIKASNSIVQEGIDVDTVLDRVYDLRAVHQRGESGELKMTGLYARIGYFGSKQANISKKGHPQDPDLLFNSGKEIARKIDSLGKSLVDALSKSHVVGEVGIDYLLDRHGKVYVLEVNSRPGSQGFRMMREWNHDHIKGALPIEYGNDVKQKWGEAYIDFLANPARYAKYSNSILAA